MRSLLLSKSADLPADLSISPMKNRLKASKARGTLAQHPRNLVAIFKINPPNCPISWILPMNLSNLCGFDRCERLAGNTSHSRRNLQKPDGVIYSQARALKLSKGLP